MRATQAEKAERFRALHAGPDAFVIPNPWDAGTARILAGFGFEALTTTSAGLAFTLGRRRTRPAVSFHPAETAATRGKLINAAYSTMTAPCHLCRRIDADFFRGRRRFVLTAA